MTEYERAIKDIRSDIIDEVATSMPSASAQQVVAAIVARLNNGLPNLVEVKLSARTVPDGDDQHEGGGG